MVYNCPCGSDECNKIWCNNNWLTCKNCGNSNHEDYFYDCYTIHCDDDSNRDEIICSNCMSSKSICIECNNIFDHNDINIILFDSSECYCADCVSVNKFAQALSRLNEDERLNVINSI